MQNIFIYHNVVLPSSWSTLNLHAFECISGPLALDIFKEQTDTQDFNTEIQSKNTCCVTLKNNFHAEHIYIFVPLPSDNQTCSQTSSRFKSDEDSAWDIE